MIINNKIVEVALSYEGEKELKGNSGWENKSLQDEMIISGWQKGQAWCSYLAEVVWCEAYEELSPVMVASLRSLFSANAVQTHDNFWKSNFITNDVPVKGALVIWKHMKGNEPNFVRETQWIRGHIGIVIDDNKGQETFITLEGNSNSSGGREGVEVARQTRSFDFLKENGLQLMGFVHPRLTT